MTVSQYLPRSTPNELLNHFSGYSQTPLAGRAFLN